MSERTGGLNYEAEYLRLNDEVEKAKYEIAYWKERFEEVNKQHQYFLGALRAVEVIFGRGFSNDI